MTSLGILNERVLAILIGSVILLSAIAPNNVKADDPVISFFAPGDDQYIDYGEYSFSVPRPFVVLDPVVLGSSRDYPDNSTVEQIGPDTVLVRITGRVYDFLADMVADGQADIEEVVIGSNYYGTLSPTPLEKIVDSRSHPYFDASSLDSNTALRPYAFASRFDLGEQELQIQSGYNGIYVTATNANEGNATASLNIKATTNHEERKYEIEIDSRNSMDVGLYNPILVHINDPGVTPDNIDSAFALLNGKRVGLRFINGQLQLDRPIIGLNRIRPPNTVPNIVNVTGDPDHFLVEYKGHKAAFNWSYTR